MLKQLKTWKKTLSPCVMEALLMAFCVFLPILGSCKRENSGSELMNIYQADDSKAINGNSRRHLASRSEANWTVEAAIRGCSGILISPTHMLTNAHCKPRVGDAYRSGIATLGSGTANISVTRILEIGTPETIDYALLEIKWLQPMDKDQTFPPFLAQRLSDLSLGEAPDEGETVFTVGFPSDKNKIWSVTYAEGKLKTLTNQKLLRYNVGVIEGNSGGGLLKNDNFMLVGLVKGGPNTKGEVGWNRNQLEDSAVWNSAVPIWEIAAVSPVLQSIYPNGKHYLLRNTFAARTQLYLAMETLADGDRLWVAGGFGTQQIVICSLTKPSCKAGDTDVETLDPAGRIGDRYRFFVKTTKKTWNRAGVQIFAFDQAGQILARRRVNLLKAGAP